MEFTTDIFKQKLDPANILSEDAKSFYLSDAGHDMYIGEVVEIL